MSLKKKIDWANHLVGLLVIIFSVTLSFILQDIREDSLERSRNLKFLERIASDLESDREALQYMLNVNEASIKAGDYLIECMGDRAPNADSVVKYLGPSMYHLPLQLRTSNYESIKNSGVIYSFEDSLVNRMIRHYDYDYGQVRYFTDEVYEIQHNRIYPLINSSMDLSKVPVFGDDGIPVERSDVSGLLLDFRLKNELLLMRIIRETIRDIGNGTTDGCNEIIRLIEKELQ
jgi:hypothetical protein